MVIMFSRKYEDRFDATRRAMKPMPFLAALAEPVVERGAVRMKYNADVRMNVLVADESLDVATFMGTLLTETRESRDQSESDVGTAGLANPDVSAGTRLSRSGDGHADSAAINAAGYFGTLETKTREGRDTAEGDAGLVEISALNIGTLLTKTEEARDQTDSSLALGFFGTTKTDAGECSDPYDVV